MFNPFKAVWGGIKQAGKWLDNAIGEALEKEYEAKESKTYSRNYKICHITYKNSYTFTIKGYSLTGQDFGLNGSDQKKQIKYNIKIFFEENFDYIWQIDTKYKLGLSYYELNSSLQAMYNYHRPREEKKPLSQHIKGLIRDLTDLAGITDFSGAKDKIKQQIQRNYQIQANIYQQNFNRQINNKNTQSTLLTEYIINGAYAIYANGEYFKNGAPGSESFNPTAAFDTLKGICAIFSNNSIDDMLMGRFGSNLAGGNSFLSSLCGINLQKNDEHINFIQQNLKNNCFAIIKRISQGFKALLIFQTGYIKGNYTYFQIDNRINQKYNRVIKTQTQSTKLQIIQNDFLQKLKNYNKNLRADFNFLNLAHFSKKSKQHLGTMRIKSYDELWKEFIDDKTIPTKNKAVAFVYEIAKKLRKFRDLFEKRYIKIELLEGKILALLDEKENFIKITDFSMILSGFYAKTSINLAQIIDTFDQMTSKLKKVDIYRKDKIIANYAFIDEMSCVFMDKNTYEYLIKKPALNDEIKGFNFKEHTIEISFK